MTTSIAIFQENYRDGIHRFYTLGDGSSNHSLATLLNHTPEETLILTTIKFSMFSLASLMHLLITLPTLREGTTSILFAFWVLTRIFTTNPSYTIECISLHIFCILHH